MGTCCKRTWVDMRGRDGCYLQVTKPTAYERMKNLCLVKRVPWGLKARLDCHPHTKGALIVEHLVPWCHLSLGSNTSQQGWSFANCLVSHNAPFPSLHPIPEIRIHPGVSSPYHRLPVAQKSLLSMGEWIVTFRVGWKYSPILNVTFNLD